MKQTSEQWIAELRAQVLNAQVEAGRKRSRFNPARYYWKRSARKWTQLYDEALEVVSSPRREP